MSKFWILVVFSAFLLGSCQTQAPEQKNKEDQTEKNKESDATKIVSEVLSPSDFEAKFKATEGAQLIDVRTPGEVADGTLENATNINFQEADFKEKMAKLDKNKPVFVYCQGGVRSAKAASTCKEMGFKEIYDMKGGYGSYEASKH